jgi:hypothetical protein
MVNYEPTLGVEVTPARCHNSIFNLWDCAGNPAFGGLGAGYWNEAHGMIVVHRGVISEASGNKMMIFQAMNPHGRVLAIDSTGPVNRQQVLNYFI